MKKTLSIALSAILVLFLMTSLYAKMYDSIEVPEGAVSFADEVNSYTAGPSIGSGYDNPQNALGEPNHVEGGDPEEVSLGKNGSLELKFTDNQLTTSGDASIDLWIFEVGIVEPGNIFISKDGSNWISVGSIAGATAGVDIDPYVSEAWGQYSYVKIEDTGADITAGTDFPGLDIDAVAALSSDPPAEISPQANAGGDQTVATGAAVTLDGSNSIAPSTGSITAYAWTQTDGTDVTLTNANAAVATFTAPSTAPQSLIFQLAVTSDTGVTDTDTVIVNVVGEEELPVARISPKVLNVDEGVTVLLSGEGSTAANGKTLVSYSWTQASGTSVLNASSSTQSTFSFTSPDVGTSGDALQFELVVTDSDGLKSTDTCVVNVNNNNTVPNADAGADQTVDPNVTVSLDGTGSTDPDENDALTYSWKQVSGPTVTLSNANAATASFTSPVVDNVALEFELTVTDNGGLKATDKCIVNVTSNASLPNAAPTANAGEDQTALSGTTVTLDGSASAASSGATITAYSWSQLSGTPVVLSDATSATPTFTALPSTDPVTFELTITDSSGLKATDQCVVTVLTPSGGGSDSCFINSLK